MKFEKPTLPQFKLNADDCKALRQLTEYLMETADNNAEEIINLDEVIVISRADYDTLYRFIASVLRYDFYVPQDDQPISTPTKRDQYIGNVLSLHYDDKRVK